MRFRIDPNITTTLLVGAAIIGVTQTTISAASAATDQRFAQLEARMDRRFEHVDVRFERIEDRFERVEDRFERVEDRFERVDARFEKMDARIDLLAAGIGRLEGLIQGFHAALAADAAVSEQPGDDENS